MAGGNCNRPLGQRNDRPEVEVSIAPLGLPGTLVHPLPDRALCCSPTAAAAAA